MSRELPPRKIQGMHWREVLAGTAAAFFFGAAIVPAVRSAIADTALAFGGEAQTIVPPGHLAQTEIVRSTVPRGTTLFYIMDTPEAWQLGLWQRSLYPDYTLIPIYGEIHLRNAEGRAWRRKFRVAYAIAAGKMTMETLFIWKRELPNYPNGIPVILGRMRPE